MDKYKLFFKNLTDGVNTHPLRPRAKRVVRKTNRLVFPP